ncbi:MAG: hypothetical protein PVG07_10540 [Acidobacteriota bacterium]|jgi:hypothetical protein
MNTPMHPSRRLEPTRALLTAALAFVLCFGAVGVAQAVDATRPATQLANLQDHVQTFIDRNLPGQATATVTPVETVSDASDLQALSALVADNLWIIASDGSGFSQITGPANQRQQFVDQSVMPRLINGALVAEVVWSVNGETVVTYAVTDPAGNPVGDTSANFESVTRNYFVETTTLTSLSRLQSSTVQPKPISEYHKTFVNGFGSEVAHYDAWLNCVGGDTCSGNSTCNDSGPCGCQERKKVRCLPNGNCQMDVAFVGYCVFPSVEFSSEEFSFSVSGFGWQYFSASLTLDKECECTQAETGDVKQVHESG